MQRLFLSIFILHFAIAVVWAQSSRWQLEPQLQKGISAGVDLILKQEYSKADSLFSELCREYPDHPSGYLYRVAVLQARSIDFSVTGRAGNIRFAACNWKICSGKNAISMERILSWHSRWL